MEENKEKVVKKEKKASNIFVTLLFSVLAVVIAFTILLITRT